MRFFHPFSLFLAAVALGGTTSTTSVDEEGSGVQVFEEAPDSTTHYDLLIPLPLFTSRHYSEYNLLPCYPLSNYRRYSLAENVSIRKMMGRWMEGVTSKRSDGRKCIVHEYRNLNMVYSAFYFDIFTTYRETRQSGPLMEELDFVFSKDGPSMMRLGKSTRSTKGLWIYKVGPEGTDSFGNAQYEYAIVSDCNKYPLTVLVRNQETFKLKYKKEVLRWLRDNKFKTDGLYSLVQPAYSSCYYTDSVSQIISD